MVLLLSITMDHVPFLTLMRVHRDCSVWMDIASVEFIPTLLPVMAQAPLYWSTFVLPLMEKEM
jgi:hypothetical protein